LTLIHDDGAVAYLNGTEVGRANLPAGDVDRQTAAPSSIEAQATSFIVPRSLIRSGTNVLAASIHNADLDSSDLSFTALLLPVAGAAAAVDCNALFQRGDVTADGSLNIADPIALLGHLFLGAAAPACLDAGDADDGGTLVIGDAILLLNFLFVSGSPPAPPGVDCGRDPNPDPLGDCATGACGA
jgi:hypothetical protein